MLSTKVRQKIKDRSGMTLAIVIIVFSLIVIMVSTIVTTVYSDSKLSADDENGKKAYYAAHSAIEVVEKAILNNLGELQDAKGAIINNIRDDVDDLNERFVLGEITEDDYQIELEAIIASYSSDIDDFKGMYSDFRDDILPDADFYTHTVTIDGFETDSDSFDVTVTPIPNTDPDDDILIDAFRLETEATVNNKTTRASKWVGIQIKSGEEITVETLAQETVTDNHVFDDAIYSYGDLQFGPGGGSAAEVIGGITYEGNLVNGDNVNQIPYHKTPPTEIEDIVEPITIIPRDMTKLQERLTTLPLAISTSNDGYYKQAVTLKGNYTVNTAAGDVVLKFSSISVDKKGYSFTVTGGNDLFIYLYDQKANGVDFDLNTNTNNETPFTTSGGSKIYFVIDQPVNQRNPATNVMSFDLGKNKITMENVYIYAPFTSLSFNNKFDYSGSIVVGGLDVKNNATVTYHETDNNPPTPGDEIFVGDEIVISISGTDSMNYNGGSYWLKK